MNEEQLRSLIREELDHPVTINVSEAVKIAVHETLVTLGMDARDPLELQQDMHFLREMRLAHEKIRTKGLLVLVAILVTAAATAVWLGIKSSFAAH